MHNKHSYPLGPLLTLIVHFILFSFPFFLFFILLAESVYWVMVYCSLFKTNQTLEGTLTTTP